MPPVDRPRVLLLWPGGLFEGGANFGVPQLLMLASALKRRTGAVVDIVDLDMERGFGAVDLRRLTTPGYDLVGISCYSSFDYLKVLELGARLRALLPRAWFVTGGYHPSARPNDFTGPESSFDYVVVGDGEHPLVRLVQALESGKRPLTRVLGPDAVPHPSELVPYDWSLLDRYRPIARRMASQAEIYLSRGCPYDCAFCMERAKRDVSWRSLDPLEAFEELHRLDRYLDLSRWTLFVADALFGMKRTWRRALLEKLADQPLRARKTWLLIRLDLIEREDLVLMARANVSPGFGLESGAPDQLRRIRKSGQLEGYLDKMLTVSEWARELNVPFGANVIVGHPGETEQTLRTSARYLERLFLGHPGGTHGFLSVDPFRLYPGSPIDEDRASWEQSTGLRVHRYPWWHDGDQEFLSEWVDPSHELDFARCLQLRHELFDPILHGIVDRFAYTGPSRDYYLRAVKSQVAATSARRRLHTLGLHRLWSELLGERAPRDAGDLPAVARAARKETIAKRRIAGSAAVLGALERVPRERFVSDEQLAESADDRALPLSADGQSSISALHAYAAQFTALELAEGDALVELGAGSGYGAAVGAEVVGPSGRVLALEIDADLARRARQNVAEWPQAEVRHADAHAVALWRGARKVSCTFAVREIPSQWIEALAPDGVLVAPVGDAKAQVLTLVRKTERGVARRALGAVRFVLDRGEPAPAASIAVAP